MSRQTTWVVTGALSILALGGGVVVSSTAGENRLDGLGPALELSANPERASETDQKSPPGASWTALTDRLGADGATTAEPTQTVQSPQTPPSPETPAADPEPVDEPTTVAPPPVTVHEPELSSVSTWSPPSVPSPSTWSPPSTPSS